jgi:Cys-tRNA(Pro)/Cys-tRNA(Cys) deacylase
MPRFLPRSWEKKMEYKTNVMRILDKNKISYKSHSYANTSAISGAEVARALGQNPAQVFKTLVTISKSRAHYVFLVPVEEELDLKKAAASVGEKAVEMIKSKELLPATGYVHGGCSPIGMKKNFTTTVHATAKDFPTIVFSAGKIGYQVELSVEDLAKIVPLKLADLI